MKKWYGKAAVCMLAAAAVAAGVYYGDGKTVRALSEQNAAPTLVLDAGHGGFDGGAVGATGTTEQDINLSIARRTAVLAQFFGVRTAMTRENTEALDYHAEKSVRDNKITDIQAREQITKDTPRAVFISIHLNKFGDPQYHGAQVFYSQNHADSRVLAETLQNNLIAGVDPQNHRQAQRAENTIYLMKKLDCPAVIVECGFLSNPAEEALLGDEQYHKKLAVCIVTGYLQYASAR